MTCIILPPNGKVNHFFQSGLTDRTKFEIIWVQIISSEDKINDTG